MSTHRVLINRSYGGWALSQEALTLVSYYCTEQGIPDLGEDLPRHHPVLLQVFDELGSDLMSGGNCKIKCVEMSGDLYRINEYDGKETLITPKDITDQWVRIKSQ